MHSSSRRTSKATEERSKTRAAAESTAHFVLVCTAVPLPKICMRCYCSGRILLIASELFTAEVGCNTRFRFSKYIAGEHFAEHCDSMCCFGAGRYSLLTVNIYLNDLSEDEAGRTRFYTDEKLVRPALPLPRPTQSCSLRVFVQ